MPLPPRRRVFTFGLGARLGFSPRLPASSLLWPPAFTGFLHQISHSHDLGGGAGSFCGSALAPTLAGARVVKKDEGARALVGFLPSRIIAWDCGKFYASDGLLSAAEIDVLPSA